ncbi:hypothetical protein PanWU01x14_328420, partial [Parasponia andersonii]
NYSNYNLFSSFHLSHLQNNEENFGFSFSSRTKHNKRRLASFLSHASLDNIGSSFLSSLPSTKHSLKETIETTNSGLQLFPTARSKSLYRLIIKGTVDLFNI